MRHRELALLVGEKLLHPDPGNLFTSSGQRPAAGSIAAIAGPITVAEGSSRLVRLGQRSFRIPAERLVARSQRSHNQPGIAAGCN